MYTPKSREEYIAKCLFYNGNDDFNSYKIGSQWAWYEHLWVDWHYDDDGLKDIRENLKRYKEFGLGHFRKDDGVPITLKALYRNRWYNKGVEGMGTADEFKEFYRQGIVKKHYISKCRYYTGNEYEGILHGNEKMFAYYERCWVKQQMKNKVVKDDVVTAWLGKGDLEWLQTFNKEDGVPLSLKALLFNRYMHWHDYSTNEDFAQWWHQYYLRDIAIG